MNSYRRLRTHFSLGEKKDKITENNLYVCLKLHFIPFTMKSAKTNLYIHVLLHPITFSTNHVKNFS
uniref:Uncharacterized protein n=1 Tax=Helianthus annuus TaxID=4232 RepID=A0A251TTD6_HELAN